MFTANTIAKNGYRLAVITFWSFTLIFVSSRLLYANRDHIDQLLISGRLAYSGGNYMQAEHDYRLAVVESEANGSSGIQMVLASGDLGSVLLSEGRFAEAETCFTRAIAVLKGDASVNRSQLPVLLGNLGKVYQHTGRYPQAEIVLREALKLSRRLLAEQPLYVADLHNSLGVLHFTMGNINHAEHDFKKALALTDDVSDGIPHRSPILSNLATMYFVQQKWSLAEELLHRSIVSVEESRGMEHPDLCPLLDNAGYIYRQVHKLVEAEMLLRRSLAIREKSMGAENAFTAATVASLAQVLADRGQYEEAGRLYADALKTQEIVFGLQSQQVARSLDGLADVLRHTHDDDQAKNMEARAESIRLRLSYTVSVKDLHH